MLIESPSVSSATAPHHEPAPDPHARPLSERDRSLLKLWFDTLRDVHEAERGYTHDLLDLADWCRQPHIARAMAQIEAMLARRARSLTIACASRSIQTLDDIAADQAASPETRRRAAAQITRLGTSAPPPDQPRPARLAPLPAAASAAGAPPAPVHEPAPAPLPAAARLSRRDPLQPLPPIPAEPSLTAPAALYAQADAFNPTPAKRPQRRPCRSRRPNRQASPPPSRSSPNANTSSPNPRSRTSSRTRSTPSQTPHPRPSPATPAPRRPSPPAPSVRNAIPNAKPSPPPQKHKVL